MFKVIIVEDDPMVASINKQFTEATESFHVEEVFSNALSALDYLKNSPADLILLDYYMNGMNGKEFMDHLHAMGIAPAVIMVTSANESDTVLAMLRRGVIDYLVKPFEYQRFKAALERFQARYEKLRSATAPMDQGYIDALLSSPSAEISTQPAHELAKGMNEKTLEMVRLFFRENTDGAYTSEQIAEHLGLSRITIRRYVNYLVDTQEIESSIDYKTGGRPSIKYKSRILR